MKVYRGGGDQRTCPQISEYGNGVVVTPPNENFKITKGLIVLDGSIGIYVGCSNVNGSQYISANGTRQSRRARMRLNVAAAENDKQSPLPQTGRRATSDSVFAKPNLSKLRPLLTESTRICGRKASGGTALAALIQQRAPKELSMHVITIALASQSRQTPPICY